MRRAAAILASGLLGALAAVPAAVAAAPRVEVRDLLADPAAYSAPAVPEIVVRGELVGDYGRRGDEVWTQLNGDAYAERPLLGGGSLAGGNLGIGVRIPAALWQDLGEPGGYRHRGAIVEVTGAWRFHDPGRGGESYLDATALEVVAPEQPLEESKEWWALGVGGVLLAAAGLIAVRSFRRG